MPEIALAGLAISSVSSQEVHDEPSSSTTTASIG